MLPFKDFYNVVNVDYLSKAINNIGEDSIKLTLNYVASYKCQCLFFTFS